MTWMRHLDHPGVMFASVGCLWPWGWRGDNPVSAWSWHGLLLGWGDGRVLAPWSSSSWISGIQHPKDGRKAARLQAGWGSCSRVGGAVNSGALRARVCLFICLPRERKQILRQVPQGWKLQSWASFAGRLHIKLPSRKEGERLLWGEAGSSPREAGGELWVSHPLAAREPPLRPKVALSPSLSPWGHLRQDGAGVSRVGADAGCCPDFAFPILQPFPWQCFWGAEGQAWVEAGDMWGQLKTLHPVFPRPGDIAAPWSCPAAHRQVGTKPPAWGCGANGETLVWGGLGQAAPCFPPLVQETGPWKCPLRCPLPHLV